MSKLSEKIYAYLLKYEYIVHVLVWMAYNFLIFITNYLAFPQIKVLNFILLNIPVIISFYLIIFFLRRKKKLSFSWASFVFLSAFTVMALVAYFYIYTFLPNSNINLARDQNIRIFLANALVQYFRVYALAIIYVYIKDSIIKKQKITNLEIQNQKLENEKILNELDNALLKKQHLESEQQKLVYEYAFLRAQINPHFLHNTLNVLYSQAMPFSKDLSNNILKLSSIMRYSLESLEYESGKVPVQKELEHLQNVIEINNLRFGDSKTIRYHVEGNLNGQMLPPLSLITIVENAFKYGDLKDPKQPLEIRVKLFPGEVYFFCRNKKKKHSFQISSSSIGITNLSKRLDNAFKNKYTMNVKDEEDIYTFELNVKS